MEKFNTLVFSTETTGTYIGGSPCQRRYRAETSARCRRGTRAPTFAVPGGGVERRRVECPPLQICN